MEGQNPYERKYKQLSMLGKGNYGKPDWMQAKYTKSSSTMERKAKTLAILSPRKCSLKGSQRKISSLPMEK